MELSLPAVLDEGILMSYDVLVRGSDSAGDTMDGSDRWSQRR